LAPGDGLLLALPVRSRVEAARSEDLEIVMSPRSGTTWRLARFLLRRPGGDVLDVGCGCGLLGLLAAAGGGRLAAGDINPHAVNVAAFNAALNGVACDGRVGDFFAPFEGRTFDHVVSNPPYVLSPRRPDARGFVDYREAGLPGDRVSELVVRSMPRFLRPGGHGQALINWAHVRGEDDRERVRSWAAGSGCDAWFLRFNTLDAAHYAAQWAPLPDDDALDAFPPVFDAWMAYYEAERIEAVSFGLVTLRARPGGRTWFALQDAPNPAGPCADFLRRGFVRRDLLQTADDAALLAARLRVDLAARWVQEWRPGGEGWGVASSELRLAEGAAAALNLDANALAVLHGLRGDRPLGEVLRDLAGEWGRPPADVVGPCLRLVRGLLEQGYVEPA
jgi:SAM-dependent methyltransferase